MKAIVYRESGGPDVLGCEEIDEPVPGDDEVRIRVRAASINPIDWRMMQGGPWFLRPLLGRRKGKVTGHDVAGQVDAVGKAVTRFKPGDAVFGLCRGACAEYACAPEAGLAIVPEGVTFELAASVPVAGLTALQGLRDKGQIRRGQTVLVNGAAGGVGTFAVQLAKAFGADVTAVCSASKVELVRSIGADRVIDYEQEDFTKGGRQYDLLLDNVGNLPLSACRRALTPTGRCVIVGAKTIASAARRAIGALVLSRFGARHFGMFIAKPNADDLATMAGLIAAGTITPVIDRRYRLEETPEAFRYSAAGHARGKVVITLA